MRKALISLVVFATFVSLTHTTTAAANGGFGGRPANPRSDNARTNSIFVETLNPGEEIEQTLLVANNSEVEKTLIVYSSDAMSSSDGGFACRQLAEPKVAIGTWVKLETQELKLAPESETTIDFKIAAPENAGVGEHDACILIQEKKPDSEDGAGMSLSLRTGLRVAITIPGDINRELSIASFTTSKGENGKIILTPEVSNNGNASVDAQIHARVYNIFGKELGSFGGQYSIMREDTSKWNFTMTRPFWGGTYTAQATVDYYNNDKELGKENTGEPIHLESKTARFYSVPQTPAMVIELIVLAFILLLIFAAIMKKRQKAWIEKTWIIVKIKKGDTLQAISKKRKISWKVLAKENGIKPPYSLEEIKEIKAPAVRRKGK